MIVEKRLVIEGEELILTNQRAIYWVSEKALILSDLHIGKTTHFRKHGIAIPDDILREDLGRLETLIQYYNAKQLMIVGDLFHAEYNTDMDVFKSWLSKFDSLKILLVKGNHDRLSKRLLSGFDFEVETEKAIGPFNFIHDETTATTSEGFIISGHVHPGISVKGRGKQRVKLPCYIKTSNQIILPAFSLFTGLNTKAIIKNTIAYAFTPENFFVFEK